MAGVSQMGGQDMIQDIAPHRYQNAFAANRAPENGDYLLLYREGKLLMRETEDGQITYPAVSEVLQMCTEETVPEETAAPDEQTELRGRKRIDGEDGTWRRAGLPLIFLFLIDGKAYYSIDEEPERFEGLPGCRWAAYTELRTVKPRVQAFAGITGAQLHRWRADRKYCGTCGGRMRPSRTERAFVCTSCGAVVYPKISPAVIVAVLHGDRILLTKYAGRSYARYALIAGFAEIGETIEETVHREVMEEVGVRVKNLRFYKSQPWSFSDTLLMGFFCELDGDDESITLDETELAVGEWKSRDEMPDRSDDISLTSEMMEQFRLGRI